MSKKKEVSYSSTEFWTGVIMVSTFTFFLGMAFFDWTWGQDNLDIDDELGPYMCEKHGYDFIDAEMSKEENGNLEDLKITCRQKNEIPIDDGYLVVVS